MLLHLNESVYKVVRRHCFIMANHNEFSVLIGSGITVRVTKGGSVLLLYKIRVLLKIGGKGRFVITGKINVVIKTPFEQFDTR